MNIGPINTFLDRIDVAPISNDDFTFEFNSWVSVLVDSLNETIAQTETFINIPVAGNYTTAEITALNTASLLPDGVFLYCTDHTPPCYVGRISGSLVQFTTTAFP